MSQRKTPRQKTTVRAARSTRARRVPGKSRPPARRVAAKSAPSRRRPLKQRPVRKPAAARVTPKLSLVARDPRWLYAHWNFTREQQRRLDRLSAAGHLVLRVFQDAPGGRLVAQANLGPDSSHWFFPVGHAETRYVAELGYQPRRGQWVSVAVSNPVVTPPDTIAPPKPVTFATLPPDVPFPQMLEALGAAVAKDLPLVQAILQFRAAGRQELPQVSVVTGPKRWPRKQAHELAIIAGAQPIRRRMIRELASLTAAHILPETPILSAEHILPETPPASPGGGWSGDWH
jgi:hypothetical protein